MHPTYHTHLIVKMERSSGLNTIYPLLLFYYKKHKMKQSNHTNKANIICLVLIILATCFWINLVKAEIIAGDTLIIDFNINPVVCINDYNLSYQINGNQVSIDIPINYYGNFNITCFDNVESQPQVVYIGGGNSGSSRTIYKNNTEYVTQYLTKEVPTIKEVIKEVPINKIIKEPRPFYKNFWFYCFIVLGIIVIIIFMKGGQSKNEQENINV